MKKRNFDDKIRRGIQSRLLLDDQAFIDAVANVEAKLMQSWESSGATQSDKREILWFQLNALRLVVKELHGAVKNEKLERERIEQAEKKPPQITPID